MKHPKEYELHDYEVAIIYQALLHYYATKAEASELEDVKDLCRDFNIYVGYHDT